MSLVKYRAPTRVNYGAAAGALARYAAPAALSAAKYLLSKPTRKAVSPAKAIANTKLKSYLDRRYERKCGTEVKMRDATGTPAVGTSLATLESPFLNIAQGLTDANRIGSHIEVKSYRLVAQFACGTISTGPAIIRIICLKQNQMQNAVLTGASVLSDPTNIRSPYLEDKQRSFTVLKDTTFTLSAFNSGNKDTLKRWVWNYNPKGCHSIKWDTADTTGAAASMLEGNLQIMVMYELPSGVASAPTVKTYSRAKWVDP